MMGRRLIHALDLIDDSGVIARYRERHAPGAVWPEVIEHLRATGVIEMEIWGFNNRLFMIAQVTTDFPRDVPEPPRVAEWERVMSSLQQPLPGAPTDKKWVEMALLFKLSQSTQQL